MNLLTLSSRAEQAIRAANHPAQSRDLVFPARARLQIERSQSARSLEFARDVKFSKD